MKVFKTTVTILMPFFSQEKKTLKSTEGAGEDFAGVPRAWQVLHRYPALLRA